MTLQARISPGYRWRIGIVGIALLAFGCWFIYDWQVGYPAARDRWLAFEQIQQEFPETYQSQWDTLATSRGWPTDEPKAMTESDVQTQLYYALPCFAIGLPFFFSFLLMGRRYLAIDDDGVFNHTGTRVNWADITDVDKARWKTKGIAIVQFQGGKIVLDDWKFDQKTVQAIVAHIDTQRGHDQPADDTPPPVEDTPPSSTPTA